MKPRTFLSLLVFTLIIIVNPLPDTLHAQVDRFNKGDTVRVKTQNYMSGRLMGTLVDLKMDTLTIQVGKKELLIPHNKILRLEVARGRKSNTGKGLKIGALTGGLGLGLVAAISVSGEQRGWFTPTPGQAFLGGLVSGGLLGALTGAIIGSGSTSPRWVKIPLHNLQVMEKPLIFPPESRQYSQTKIARNRVPKSASRRKLGFSFVLGTTSGGPAASIEEAMRKDGFDETSPGGFFGGPVTHPFSNTGLFEIGAPWSIQVNYTVNQIFDAALLVSHNPIGFTSGYRTGPEVFLHLDYYSTVITPMFIYKPSGIVQLGLGPGLIINKIEQEDAGIMIYRERKSRFGLLLEAAIRYPQKTRLFVELNTQYRYVGKPTFGPFKDTYHGTSSSQLNAFDSDFSHIFVGLGMGIRI